MDIRFQRMKEDSATDICNWRYPAPYDFYNLNGNEIVELMTGSYFVVTDNTDTIGFFCVGASAQVPAGHQHGVYAADEYVDVGLGMRPDLTGQGLGFEFVSAVLAQVEDMFRGKSQRLTVATFNSRAIKLYENVGFVGCRRFWNGHVEFMVMERR